MEVTLVIVPQEEEEEGVRSSSKAGIPRPHYGNDGWAYLYWPYLYLVYVATLPLWLATVVGLPVTSVGASITRPKMNQRSNSSIYTMIYNHLKNFSIPALQSHYPTFLSLLDNVPK